jgi:hypothetical protein
MQTTNFTLAESLTRVMAGLSNVPPEGAVISQSMATDLVVVFASMRSRLIEELQAVGAQP